MRLEMDQLREQHQRDQTALQAATAQITAMQTAAQSTAPAPSPPAPTPADEITWSRAPLREPTVAPFDGQGDYRPWRLDLVTNAEVYAAAWSSPKARVVWAYGRLLGKAKRGMEGWMELYVAREYQKAEDFEEFVAACDEQFDDRDAQQKREDDFYNLRQGKRPFREFLADWLAALRAARLDLPQKAKERALREAMSPDLRREARSHLLTVPTWDGKLAHLKELADLIESEKAREATGGWRRGGGSGNGGNGGGGKGSNGGNGDNSSDSRRGNSATEPTPPKDPDEMDWVHKLASTRRAKWVDVEERQRRRDNGLCIRCGGKGHLARGCPVQPPLPPERKTAAAGTIAAGMAPSSARRAPQSNVFELDEDGLEPEEAGKGELRG
jgi:hypothetical protein